MKSIYHIEGMSCKGCSAHVAGLIKSVEGVIEVEVDLEKAEAAIESTVPIALQTLETVFLKDGGNYGIHAPTPLGSSTTMAKKSLPRTPLSGNGIYYCPMHCEGEKTYSEFGSCPVCGMDLVMQHLVQNAIQYHCPAHPENTADKPGTCSLCGKEMVIGAPTQAEPVDKNYESLIRKLRVAIIFTLPIFVIAMTEMWKGNPLFNIISMKYWNIVELLFSIPVVFYAAWMFFERAWRSLITARFNMFTLIGIGAGAAWLFSVFAILMPNIFPDAFKTHHGTVYVYFEAATVILTLVLLGQVLEARAHSSTGKAIAALLKLTPNQATRITNGKQEVLPISAIEVGDVLLVKPGEKVPVDGSITKGNAIIDESMITGEPIPVEKSIDDKVVSGTINGNKAFEMHAEKIGAETLLAKIIEMVNSASRSKAPIQQLADKISGYFVPVVVLISAVTFILWRYYGPEPAYVYAFINAIAVLIIACPCALGLATPMSVMVGVGKGAQSGILIKNAEALQRMNDIQVLIVDKTGTLTEGKPSVSSIQSFNEAYSETEILQSIISLNQNSDYPLAKASIQYAATRGLQALPTLDFEAIPGKGVKAKIASQNFALGNWSLMTQLNIDIPIEILSKANEAASLGNTVSFLATDKLAIGLMVITDKLKPSAMSAVQGLQQEGLKVMMLTGDNEVAGKSVSEALHLDGYKAHMLPEDKLHEIKKLQNENLMVAMAGDGINDAPALSQADIGIAMGAGTDVAIESAAITLVKGDLNGILKARKLSKEVMKNIKQNLFFALAYNMIGIPLAAGVLYPFTGILLSPMIAALAMSFSSVSVIGNALRLRNKVL